MDLAWFSFATGRVALLHTTEACLSEIGARSRARRDTVSSHRAQRTLRCGLTLEAARCLPVFLLSPPTPFMTFDEIVSYMQADGWPIEPLRDNTIRSSFRGERRAYNFFVHVEGTYLIVAAVPYLRLPVEEPTAVRLMDRLLHLNREMTFAKFSVDDDGDVILSVEYPIANLDESELRDALDVLSFYADRHWQELTDLGGELQSTGPF